MDPRGFFFFYVSALFLLSSSLSLHQYHMVKDPNNWADAQNYCRQKYTDLATINSMKEMNNLMTVVNPNGTSVWIGLGKGDQNRWHRSFIDTQGNNETVLWKLSAFTPFGDCVAMQTSGQGQNYYCDAQYPCVCINGSASAGVNYVLVSTLMAWDDAQSYCRGKYTDLANVIDLASQSAVKVAANQRNAWVGLFRDQWMWSDNSKSSFRNWFPGNLEHRNNCARSVTQLGGKWEDSPCSWNLPFVCHGAPKTKVTPIKMKMTSDLDLTSKELSDQILQQLSKVLTNLGLIDYNLRWNGALKLSKPVVIAK